MQRNKNSRRFLQACFLFLSFAFCSCSSKPESTNRVTSTKFEQYYVQGEQLYIKNCSNCHQKSGTGLGLVYPPLNKSDYLENNFQEVICLMKYGTKGELIVNEKNFNKPMPGVMSLTDLETAEIATYIYNTWEHKRGMIEVQDVSRIISQCRDSLSVNR